MAQPLLPPFLFSLPSVPAGSATPAMNSFEFVNHTEDRCARSVSFPVAGTRQLVLACAIVNEKTTKMKEEGWGSIVRHGISVAYGGGVRTRHASLRNTWIYLSRWLKFSSVSVLFVHNFSFFRHFSFGLCHGFGALFDILMRWFS